MNALKSIAETVIGLIFDDIWLAGGTLLTLIITFMAGLAGLHAIAALVILAGIVISLSLSLWQVPPPRR